MKAILVAIAGLALAGCGGSAQPDSTTPADQHSAQSDASHDGEHAEHAGTEHAHGGAKHEDHDHDFPPSMKTFHDVMSPVWHSDPGPERIATACDANDDWVAKAGAIADAPVPEGVDETAWKDGSHQLNAAVEDFGSVCESDAEQSEAQLKAIHDAFHVLLDLLPKN